MTAPEPCGCNEFRTHRSKGNPWCVCGHQYTSHLSGARCQMSGKGVWLGHSDLCPTQWGQECTCRCSDDACPGVDRCADDGCQFLWPNREPFLRRVNDIVEDL